MCNDLHIGAARSSQAGKFQLLQQQVRVEFDDGSSVIGPAGEVTVSARSVADTVKDIYSIFCKVYPTSSLCSKSGGGGGNPGCYVITGPDGTTITICPPVKTA